MDEIQGIWKEAYIIVFFIFATYWVFPQLYFANTLTKLYMNHLIKKHFLNYEYILIIVTERLLRNIARFQASAL